MSDQTIEQRLEAVEARNARVEADKAWETSSFRILSLVVITYVIAWLLLEAIGNTNPFRNAMVPAAGFYLSTQSLPILKRWWVKNRLKK